MTNANRQLSISDANINSEGFFAGICLLDKIHSKGFLAEVFHPWVRWEGPGSGFENSSGAGGAGAGGAWVGPSWAQVTCQSV